MNEIQELKQELEQELQWVQYRQKMLGIIEDKLIVMKGLAQQAKNNKLSPRELEELTVKLNSLAMQVIALDSESRKNECL